MHENNYCNSYELTDIPDDGIKETEGALVGDALGTCEVEGDSDGAGVLKVGADDTLGDSEGLRLGLSDGETLGMDDGRSLGENDGRLDG